MKMLVLKNNHQDFYLLMGPFLARREIEKEIGYQLYDDDDKEWFIALERGYVVAFCYRQEKTKGTFQIGSCYTVEERRQKGIFKKLLAKTTKGLKGNVELTTRNKDLQRLLIREGFTEIGTRGSFARYRKEF